MAFQRRRVLSLSVLVALALAPGAVVAQSAVEDGGAPPAAETTQPAPAEGPPVSEQPDEGWWHTGYLVDYGVVAVAIGSILVGRELRTRIDPLFGAPFEPDDAFDDPDERINREYLFHGPGGETVPTAHLLALIPSLFGGVVLLEGGYFLFSDDGDPAMFHDVTVGFLESLALTIGATEILKAAVGRLRPDFSTRLRISFCVENPDSPECEGLDLPPDVTQAELEEILEDGRRSFPSGHASTGANVFTYTALVLGGRYVWGHRATRLSRGLGLLAQTLAIGAGVFIGTSRLDDGRHHDTDVFSGILLGFGMANLAYWRRFDGDGRLLERDVKRRQGSVEARLVPGPGNAGVALQLRY